jgi:hypothetical protein
MQERTTPAQRRTMRHSPNSLGAHSLWESRQGHIAPALSKHRARHRTPRIAVKSHLRVHDGPAKRRVGRRKDAKPLLPGDLCVQLSTGARDREPDPRRELVRACVDSNRSPSLQLGDGQIQWIV